MQGKDGQRTNNTSSSLAPRSVTVEIWVDASGLVGWGGHRTRGGQVQGRWISKQLPTSLSIRATWGWRALLGSPPRSFSAIMSARQVRLA